MKQYLPIAFLMFSVLSLCADERTKAFCVKGNTILDPEGRPFVVKGIASPLGPFCGNVKTWDSTTTIGRDYDLIRSLGCNLVRIFVARNQTSTDIDRAKLIDTVAQARKRGFVVEIANGYTSFEDSATKPFVGRQGWLGWLASQWKDDPYVWLQPMNEPNGAPPGEEARVGDWPYWQLQHNRYIAAIRSTGNTAPLVINMPNWSHDFSGIAKFPLDDPRRQLIYAPHRYPYKVTEFTEKEKAECDSSWGNLSSEYALIVDECGPALDDQHPAPYLEWTKGFLNYCSNWVNRRGGSGVVAFVWYWCSDDSMTGDWRTHLNNGELNEWGKIFRDNYLNRVPSPK